MQFKKYFVSTIIGTVISCIIGVVMAYKGFGVWSLVAQYLSNTFIATLVFVFVCDWIPKFQFSFRKAKEIWRFGSKVLGANLISTGVLEIQSFLIGKHFGPADLAVMDQGKKYPSLVVNNVNSAISKAMLPYFSKNQENRALLKNKLRQTVKFSNYLLCPLLFGFCAVAPTFVDVVLTSKWSACVPYIQIFSIMYLTRPLTMIYHQVLLAIDKAGLAMALMSGINAVALLGALFSILVLKEMFAVVIFLLVADLVALVGFIIAMRVCLSWHIKEQLMDILPPVLLSVVMFAVVGFLPYLIKLSGILMLGLQILVGFLVYLCLSLLFRVEAFTWILEKGKGFLNKNKGN